MWATKEEKWSSFVEDITKLDAHHTSLNERIDELQKVLVSNIFEAKLFEDHQSLFDFALRTLETKYGLPRYEGSLVESELDWYFYEVKVCGAMEVTPKGEEPILVSDLASFLRHMKIVFDAM